MFRLPPHRRGDRAPLQEPDGPEFVVVNPMAAERWLQPLATDTARARLIKALKGLDRHGRLAMYHPMMTGGEPIYVHAKITVVDDTAIRIDSANLDRSMALDTECDVVLDAGANGGRPVGALAAALRDGLLAEHLGCHAAEVARRIAGAGGLIAAIEALRGGDKTLIPYELPDPGPAATWLADSELLDPEGPEEMSEPLARRGLFRGRLRRWPAR